MIQDPQIIAAPGPWVSLTPAHSHHVLQHNAFPLKARQLGPHQFEVTCNVDHVKETFFFDHEIDHIPGMLLACIIRQCALVVTHAFYHVPFGEQFMMNDIHVDFHRFAWLEREITVMANTKPVFSSGLFKKADLSAHLYQGEDLVASGTMKFRTYKTAVFNRINPIKNNH